MNPTTDKILNYIFDEVLALAPEEKRRAYQLAMQPVNEEIIGELWALTDELKRSFIRTLQVIPGPEAAHAIRLLKDIGRDQVPEWDRARETGFFFRETYEREAARLIAWLRSFMRARWYRRALIFVDVEGLINVLRQSPDREMQWISTRAYLQNVYRRLMLLLEALKPDDNEDILLFLMDLRRLVHDQSAIIPFPVPEDLLETF
jgi:hypothetical protein